MVSSNKIVQTTPLLKAACRSHTAILADSSLIAKFDGSANRGPEINLI